MKDASVQAVREKITLVSNKELTQARPERQSIVTVEMTNGTKKSHHAKVVRGTPDDPMPPEEVTTKARDILKPYLAGQTNNLIDVCLNRNFSISELVSVCRLGTE
jgi:2-methylcitrate dehydratase PrpD